MSFLGKLFGRKKGQEQSMKQQKVTPSSPIQPPPAAPSSQEHGQQNAPRQTRDTRQQPRINVDIPICSKCHQKLKETPSIFGRGQVVVLGGSVEQAKDDYMHFAGSICFRCRAVFCAECLGDHVDKCPQCNGEAKTAYRKTLRELANM